MQARDELAATQVRGASVVTIGVFDGVHIGHRYLIHQVKDEARQRGLASAVVTFRNHPRTVLAPNAPTTYIEPLEERLHLLDVSGIDHVVPVTFTRDLSELGYPEFTQLLIDQVGMKALMVGPDFAMGKGRAGTSEALATLGQSQGFDVLILEALVDGPEVVSTTAVRQALATGNMTRAATLLGRPFALSGQVQEGDQRGKDLGFPTANLGINSDLTLPLDGIYCTVATFGGRTHPSVTSIGVRPTFGDLARTVETFVLDFSGDLYGQQMRIDLLDRIRDEQKFPGADELIAQMKTDVEMAREMLAERGAS